MTTTVAFDEYERRMWAGQAEAYHESVPALCAGAVPALLYAAGVVSGPPICPG